MLKSFTGSFKDLLFARKAVKVSLAVAELLFQALLVMNFQIERDRYRFI